MPRTSARATVRRRRLLLDPPVELTALEERMASLAAGACDAALGPVFGEGNPRAALALVGEAPGEREVEDGYPFAGPAGALLDAVFAEVGLRREELWLTNVVKCRPVREERGRLSNRAPLAGEIKMWLPLLAEELALVQPRLLVCLGATAAKALLGRHFKLTEERGVWLAGPRGAAALATFHPAYVLHLESHDPARSAAARATLAADLGAAVARLRVAST
ncbi:MAG: uracil-DNA glycosylase [Dehalococcoidia bacterium]